ncbi:MAG: GntR family transcriptional regulator [Luteitalea sp.]|nr:GntR family transcriptional regulator [Luteitalea sp.]
MTSAAPLQPVKAGSLSRQVFEALRTAIFAGRFSPGDSLRELYLARDLNVSQATVREALAQLEQDGLPEAATRGRACGSPTTTGR